MPNLFARFTNFVSASSLFNAAPQGTWRTSSRAMASRVALASSPRALDDPRDHSVSAPAYPRDRYEYNRLDVLRDALDAWRSNALARRIVALTSQYVVGGGVQVSADDKLTHEFLTAFWNNRLNRMPTRLYEWCDELTRSGEIFVVLSTDASGMSYVRAVPAAEIQEIESAGNDIEQETGYLQASPDPGGEPIHWRAYDDRTDSANASADTSQNVFPPVMLHYFVNRPVGAKHGESDLAPLLKWLKRFDGWLEDRVRLNHFRQAFLWIVKKGFRDEGERIRRQTELNANPPNPGSILVVNEDEEWKVESAKLDSFEAGADGLALKKHIAAGSGNPLHFLAEPESSTRTTAEQAGGPTFRHYEQRQIYFLWCIKDLLQIIVRRRAMVDRRVNAHANLAVKGTDIFARDNAALSAAATTIINSFLRLRDRNLIDDAELLRLAYKFAAEVVDIPALLDAGKKSAAINIAKVTLPGGGGQGSGQKDNISAKKIAEAQQ